MQQSHLSLGVIDYIVFVATLLVSSSIGVYFALTGGHQRTTSEFLMANRNMRAIPVAMSVLASFFSASTLLGTPAEIYQHGTQYWISAFSAVLAPLTGSLLFGPMFFKLKVVSVFEYLELRYKSKAVRVAGSSIFILRATVGMGIVLYGPSTAFNTVTGFPVWGMILLVSLVCTVYTTLGGMKAVIWTDVFQTLVILAGMLAVLIQGCLRVGGVKEVWQVAKDNGRIEFFNFDFDPTVRHTFWSLLIGIYFIWLPPYTVDQQMIQRFSSARSLREAKRAILYNIPGMFVMITLCSLTGLVLYANYAHCDPLKTKQVSNPNQLLPYLVTDILGNISGIPGLFMASLFSGALSSVSSMLNSLSAVTWEDFLKQRLKNISEENATRITKLLAVIYGFLGIGMAFIVQTLGGTVLQVSLTLNGSAGAPLVGLFILGALFSSANAKGALAGAAIGFAFPAWLSIGAYVTKQWSGQLPTSTDGCNGLNNQTTFITYKNRTGYSVNPLTNISGIKSGNVFINEEKSPLEVMYSLSYLWFSVIGILLVVIVGFIVSLITGPLKQGEVADELLLYPAKACRCCCTHSTNPESFVANSISMTGFSKCEVTSTQN